MRTWFLALLCLSAALFASAQTSSTVFRTPEKPRNHVSDESQWLSQQDRLAWESELEGWDKNDGVEIYLVILPTLHDTPVEHVTQQIAEQWGKAELHGVVLYVPGSNGPSLWWNGKVLEDIRLDPQARREMISRMEKRASSQITELDRMASGIHELSDTMRVIRGQWKQMQAIRDKWNDTIYKQWSKDRFSRRTKLMIAGLVGLCSLSLLAWIISRILRRKKTFLFPRISPQRRFGAAYAGGSGAILTLKS